MKFSSFSLFLIFYFLLTSFVSKSQENNHPYIKSVGLRYEDGDIKNVSKSMDSAVIITCVIELKDTINISKIHVRVSNGKNTDGKVFKTAYSINSPAVMKEKNNYIFRRDKQTIYISTVTTTQLTDYNFEVCTEDHNGVLSPYLSWQK